MPGRPRPRTRLTQEARGLREAMRALAADAVFTGSIPDAYEALLVPLIFEPYGSDLAGRVAALGPSAVLEVAAGTGAATRALARLLPRQARLVAHRSQPADARPRRGGRDRG